MSPFLKTGDTLASFKTSARFPVSKNFLKISCRMGESSSCNLCRTMGFNLSRPAALCGFKPLSSLSMPSGEMNICFSLLNYTLLGLKASRYLIFIHIHKHRIQCPLCSLCTLCRWHICKSPTAPYHCLTITFFYCTLIRTSNLYFALLGCHLLNFTPSSSYNISQISMTLLTYPI